MKCKTESYDGDSDRKEDDQAKCTIESYGGGKEISMHPSTKGKEMDSPMAMIVSCQSYGNDCRSCEASGVEEDHGVLNSWSSMESLRFECSAASLGDLSESFVSARRNALSSELMADIAGTLFEESRTSFVSVEPEKIDLLCTELELCLARDGKEVVNSSGVEAWVAELEVKAQQTRALLSTVKATAELRIQENNMQSYHAEGI